MASQYSREQIKIAVAKICLTIGWHSVQTTSVEILTDILSHYLLQLGKSTADYANEFGMIEPNLDHLALAFRDFHVNLSELEEYVKYVDFGEPPTSVPKFPIPKEDHLNFLKPGSKEVVTRPVYIHEHLPPMHPVLEVNDNEVEEKKEEPENLSRSENTCPIFKRPETTVGEPFKRPRLLLEEEGRPTREISSVMMTTSGFLSPAREGKLPESRTPLVSIDPTPQSNNVMPTDSIKKPVKALKKVEKKKEKGGKELFKPGLDERIKKIANMKDIVKLKQVKMNNNANNPSLLANNVLLNNDIKITQIPNSKINSALPQNKFNKALEAARLKTEKLNTTITPIPIKSLFATTQQSTVQSPQVPKQSQQSPSQQSQQLSHQSSQQQQQNLAGHRDVHVDKLFTEPDKKKINILKKISNVKNEKLENKVMKIKDEIKQESRESSPDLVIDEAASDIVNKVHHLSNDITIELIEPQPAQAQKSPEKVERNYFDDDSPPGTPSTPKTPEMITQSPPLQIKEKRKRKDKSKVKKVSKHVSPNKVETDVIDVDLEPPKTPEAPQVDVKPNPPIPFSFFPSFPGPGLIPPPLNNSLFPHLPIPPLGISTFGQPPYIPPVHPGMPMNFMQQIKQEEPSVKSLPPHPLLSLEKTLPLTGSEKEPPTKLEKRGKEHKKDKKEKIKKKNKKDKLKSKAEKKKLKEERKEKIKKEKKDKRKEKELRVDLEVGSVPKLTLKLGPASPRPDTPETRKLNIKPVVKKDEEPMLPDSTDSKREMSPELAKISALVTGQPKPKSSSANNHISADHIFTSDSYSKKPVFKPIPKIRTKEIKKEPHYDVDVYNTPSSYIDAEGNKVWICPACGKQDDGSPMIGCDDCDAWYHWVCVGIQVPPDDNEDWYCRNCINKKQKDLQTKEKKKRKKREKKDH
ncbi:transcription initiation factor TFIID subunit 3 isoform X2 [Agrilus planipennis]|uniref:Transcription initiation factor TFIID subunit 3 isoform X2 n=1 Tax=Agrilus planipennis TaxID=224129 RepID=A0A7F5RC49_AGRPL|nr:transcription initiation factor TFIID subunit 3 isoform X2 [Agrilus planipennis]